MKKFLPILLISTALGFSGGVWACDGAGHNKHIGNVTNVDVQAGTFTILDMETNAPITFKASKEVLKEASGAKGPVTVAYEKSGESLQAKKIEL